MSEPELVQLQRRVAALEAELQRYRHAGQFLAHDFNNLLSAILGHAALLEAASAAAEEVREAGAVIRRAAERASELTAQWMRFTRGGLGQTVPVDLHGMIGEVIELLRGAVDPGIRLSLHQASSPAEILGDPGQIHQMLLNLALNARDAMPDGGLMTFATGDESGEGARRVRITVHDTGCGIDPAIRDRIFEPFFTTKPPERNSGMGLAIVQRVAANHGGAVEVESEPGRGTAVHVILPARQDAPAPQRAPAAAAF